MPKQLDKQAALPIMALLAGAGMAYGLYAGGKRMLNGANMIADGKTWDGIKEMGWGAAEGAVGLIPGTGMIRAGGAIAKGLGAGKLVSTLGKAPGAVKSVGGVAAQTAAMSAIPGAAEQAGVRAGTGMGTSTYFPPSPTMSQLQTAQFGQPMSMAQTGIQGTPINQQPMQMAG